MISEAKLNNYMLFCDKAKSYGVCDIMSGDDKHKRLYMGKDEHSRNIYSGHLRTDYMLIYYRSTEKVDITVKGRSKLNIPTKKYGCDYCSSIYPEDYDAFLSFVSRKLGREPLKATHGINTPMKSKKETREDNGTIKLQCPRCDLVFVKAPRCPNCGQLIKERGGLV